MYFFVHIILFLLGVVKVSTNRECLWVGSVLLLNATVYIAACTFASRDNTCINSNKQYCSVFELVSNSP